MRNYRLYTVKRKKVGWFAYAYYVCYEDQPLYEVSNPSCAQAMADIANRAHTAAVLLERAKRQK